jgi:hypothetical protein
VAFASVASPTTSLAQLISPAESLDVDAATCCRQVILGEKQVTWVIV